MLANPLRKRVAIWALDASSKEPGILCLRLCYSELTAPGGTTSDSSHVVDPLLRDSVRTSSFGHIVHKTYLFCVGGCLSFTTLFVVVGICLSGLAPPFFGVVPFLKLFLPGSLFVGGRLISWLWGVQLPGAENPIISLFRFVMPCESISQIPLAHLVKNSDPNHSWVVDSTCQVICPQKMDNLICHDPLGTLFFLVSYGLW